MKFVRNFNIVFHSLTCLPCALHKKRGKLDIGKRKERLCVCVCETDRKRERDRVRQKVREKEVGEREK